MLLTVAEISQNRGGTMGGVLYHRWHEFVRSLRDWQAWALVTLAVVTVALIVAVLR